MHRNRIDALIREELPRVVDLRHDLHRHPELGYEEERTSTIVRKELESIGIEYVGGLAKGTGVVAHLPATIDQPEKTVGLRADMDALPIVERTGLPYSSRNPGVMHACGHDGHTANLLGVARVLSQLEERKNAVTFVFQPAEEGGAGGRAMCEDGALDGSVIGPPVDRMFGLHGWPALQLGQVGTRPGALLAATDLVEVTVSGIQSHGAYPHQGEDPIVATAHIISALQSIVSRDIAPVDSGVITVGQIQAGTAENIIPETCWFKGTVRSLNEVSRRHIIDRFHEVVRHTAAAVRCEAQIDWQPGYPVTYNDHDLAEHFFGAARNVVGDEGTIHVDQPTLGGEDFAFYGEKVPACFFILGMCPAGEEAYPQLHQPNYDFNDHALPIGMGVMAELATS